MQQILWDIQNPIKRTLYIQLNVTIEMVSKQVGNRFRPRLGLMQQLMWDIQNPIKRTIHTVMRHIVQELCESRGGRPGLSVLTSLLVSVDVKIY